MAVVVWGEFGRTPRVNAAAGRDHWPRAGFAVLAGGNFKTGQTIGETDARGESPSGLSMTSSHVLTSLYGHLGIDPGVDDPRQQRPADVLAGRARPGAGAGVVEQAAGGRPGERSRPGAVCSARTVLRASMCMSRVPVIARHAHAWRVSMAPSP